MMKADSTWQSYVCIIYRQLNEVCYVTFKEMTERNKKNPKLILCSLLLHVV